MAEVSGETLKLLINILEEVSDEIYHDDINGGEKSPKLIVVGGVNGGGGGGGSFHTWIKLTKYLQCLVRTSTKISFFEISYTKRPYLHFNTQGIAYSVFHMLGFSLNVI